MGIQQQKTEKRTYLTKRAIVRLAKRATRQASIEAMALMGYVVEAREGWVVKIYKDGRIEKLEEIKKVVIKNTNRF